MGGHEGGRSRTDLRAQVLVACPAGGRSHELVTALAAAGFEVDEASDLTAHVVATIVADQTDRDTIVAIVDDSDPEWLRVVSDLVSRHPAVRPLALVDLSGPDDFLAAIGAGVAGFASPSASTDAIVRTVHSLAEQGVAIPRGMVSTLVDEVRHGRGHSVHTAAGTIDVTDREWEILQLMIQRRTTREMADSLYVSVGTVRSHVSTLLKKLGAVDRDDAIALVERGRR